MNLIEQNLREIFMATVTGNKAECQDIANKLLETDIDVVYYILKSLKKSDIGVKSFKDFVDNVRSRNLIDFDLYSFTYLRYSEKVISHQTNNHPIFRKVLDRVLDENNNYVDTKIEFPDLPKYTAIADKIFEHYEELKCKN